MNRNKPLEEGIRDNLYGIPLNDILTPEEIADLEKERKEAVIKKREKREKKKKEKSFRPEFRFDKKYYIIAGAVLALLFVFVLSKDFLSVRITPKMYVSGALEKTADNAKDEMQKLSRFLLGFDISGAKSFNAELNTHFDSDSRQKLSGVASAIKADVNVKGAQATLGWNLEKNAENILNVSVYLNEEELGVNLGNFFSEYWTFPAKEFGRKWNKSGFKNVLYAQSTDDNCDISFSNVFSTELISKENRKTVLKQTEDFYSSSKAKYKGKEELYFGDEKIRAGKISFTFAADTAEEYLKSVSGIILEDEKFKSIPGVKIRGDVVKRYRAILERIHNNIKFDRDITVNFYEYNGRVASIKADIACTENMHDTTYVVEISAPDREKVLNKAKVLVRRINGVDDYTFEFVTSGNKGGRGKVFDDKTVITETTPGGVKSIRNETIVNMKDKTVYGIVLEKEGESTESTSYEGTIEKKKGVKIVLDKVGIQQMVNGETRTIGASADLCLSPGTANKISVGSKRDILDMDKARAESYINKILETDNFKKADDKLKDVFSR